MEDDECDEFHVKAPLPGGEGVIGIRRQGDKESLSVMVPARPGELLEEGTEIVKSKIRANDPGVYDLKSVYKHKGPARVATPAFRENYDQIFGRKKNSKRVWN